MDRTLHTYNVALSGSNGRAESVQVSCYWDPKNPETGKWVAETGAAMASAVAVRSGQDTKYVPVAPASLVAA